jgi:alpha-tubulin suppressor-like RCC1 family protein
MSDEIGAIVDGRLLTDDGIDDEHGPTLPVSVEDDFLRVERIDLGAGTTQICIVSSTRSPVCAITGEPGPTTTMTLSGVRDLALCLDRPCTITTAGAVECGRITDGAFDRMAMIDLPTPAAEIACVAADTCARLSDGSVFCWTDAKYHKISKDPLYSDTPMRIPLKRVAVGLAVGFRSACARSDDGRIECWGDARSPSLADALQRGAVDSPRTVEGVHDVVQVAVGYSHSCVLHGSREVSCWGLDDEGQVGMSYSQF